MKKLFKSMFAVVFAGLMAFALVGCGSTTAAATDLNGEKFGKEEKVATTALTDTQAQEFVVGGDEESDTNKFSYTMKTDIAVNMGVKNAMSMGVKSNTVQNFIYDGDNNEYYFDLSEVGKSTYNFAGMKGSEDMNYYIKGAVKDGKYYTYEGDKNCSIAELLETSAGDVSELTYEYATDLLSTLLEGFDDNVDLSMASSIDGFTAEALLEQLTKLDEQGLVESITMQTTDTAVKYNVKFKSDAINAIVTGLADSVAEGVKTVFNKANMSMYLIYQTGEDEVNRLVESNVDMSYKMTTTSNGVSAVTTMSMKMNYRVNSITEVEMPW